MTAIDAAPESVGVGVAHAARDALVDSRTHFRHVTAEQLVAEGTEHATAVHLCLAWHRHNIWHSFRMQGSSAQHSSVQASQI